MKFSVSDKNAVKNFARLVRKLQVELGAGDALVAVEYAGGAFNVVVAPRGKDSRSFEAESLWHAFVSARTWAARR